MPGQGIDATDDWFNEGGRSPANLCKALEANFNNVSAVSKVSNVSMTSSASNASQTEGSDIESSLSSLTATPNEKAATEAVEGSSPESETGPSSSSSGKGDKGKSLAPGKGKGNKGSPPNLCEALEVNVSPVSNVSNVSMASNVSNASQTEGSDVESSLSSLSASPNEKEATQAVECSSPESETGPSSIGSGKGDKGKLLAPGKGKGNKGPKGMKGKGGKAPPAGKQGVEAAETEAKSSEPQAEEKEKAEKPEKDGQEEDKPEGKTEEKTETATKGKGPGKGPPAKGAGKGPGKGPPGKGKAPPPKGGGKAAPKSKAAATPPRYVGQTPLGRRLHWAGAHYDVPSENSVFHGLTSDVRFDPELLKAMLSGESAEKPLVIGRRKSITKKAGISLLDGSRAQNLAIVMSKMKVSTEEFCQSLKDLNFSEDFINVEDVELLIPALPTPEEIKKLLEYKDRVADLRDVEANAMPFCTLPKGAARMKVAKFALSHQSQFNTIKNRCEVLMSAAEQARSSQKFKELLDLVIRVGNFINHGVDEFVDGTIRGVSVDSLLTLASFKTGAVSSLHFLCLSLGATDPDFYQALKASLSSVHEASKEKAAVLKGSIEAFGKDAETAEKQLSALLVPNEEQEVAMNSSRACSVSRAPLQFAASPV
ncbi:FH13 [Symbiodinium pilosum]|uniref:FH13 protein n=1 Tax=Symbiodinium pilosum TaxID=2952 RepID=A0A812MTY4_SYMPI|nr:FH13 [Symbiodinium pilosum]